MSRPVIFTKKALRLARRMREEGASDQAIAEKIGTTIGSLKNAMSQHGVMPRRDIGNGYISVYVGKPTEEFYRAEARKRRTTVSKLLRDFICRGASDNLIAAVLDE